MTIPLEIANTIVNPHAYAAGQPVDDAFAAIRRDMPFEKAHPEQFDSFWVVSKHADILAIELQNDLFHNSDRSSVILTQQGEALMRHLAGGEANLVRSLVALDGLEHKQLRAIAFPSLTPQKMRGLEASIRSLARDFIDRFIALGPEADFAKEVAFLYPLRVAMKVLGVPESDEPMMLRLTQELFSSADPDLNRSGQEVSLTDAVKGVNETMLELEKYFTAVTVGLRANPRDDINSLIANAKIDGEYLSYRQMMGYYIIGVTAAHDTTSNTTGGAMWALAERPELLAQMQADPSLINGFVEESIRWAVPVKHFMRTATADTEYRGRKIAKGDWLMLSYQSANRDEDVFTDPFTFDATRKPNKQVAFGYGPHVCLGQHLARLEMRLLWEELLPRVKSIELAGEPKRTISSFVCGPKTVPIRFTLN